MKRIIIRVQRREGLKGWWTRVGGLEFRRESQYEATLEARQLAIKHMLGGGLAEVIVHGMDGTIKRRDTYPRSSDPRRSKG